MRNFKKFVAMFGVIAMVAASFPNTAFGQVDYGTEVVAGYDYALANGVTTVDNIDSANPYGLATREQAAKQFVNIAKAINPAIVADEAAACTFVDLGNADASLVPYITEVCQMGIMGQNMPEGKFLPFDYVTRAQVATMLSRIIWGDKYDGGTPWYAAHMEALKDAGIMTNISNPNENTARYAIWLMAQRADDADLVDTLPEECQDPMVQLSCALGLGEPDCPAVCMGDEDEEEDDDDTIVKEGSLDVSLNASMTPADGSSIPMGGIVPFACFDLDASNSSDIDVFSFDLERLGLGERTDVKRIYFENEDGVRISGRTSLTTDGKATVSFAPALEVKAGGSETICLIANMTGTSAGSEHYFKVLDISSSAVSVNMNNLQTPTLRTANYTIGKVYFTKRGTDTEHRAGEAAQLELGQFRLENQSANDKEVRFKTLTVRNYGNGDLATSVDNLALYRNGEKVSTSAIINGKEVTFTLSELFTTSQTATFYIRGDVTSVDYSAGDTYQFQLRNAEDLNAVEEATSFRVDVLSGNGAAFSSTNLYTYTIKGSDVTLTKDADLELSQTVAPGALDVVMMKGTISAREAVQLEDLSLAFESSVALNSLVNKMTLKIGNSTSTYTPTAVTGGTATFDGSFYISDTADVEILVDMKSTITAGGNKNFKFTQPMTLERFNIKEYVSNQNTIDSYVGSISSATINVVDSKLNIVKNDGLSSRTIVEGADDITMLGAMFSSTDDDYIDVSQMVFYVTGTEVADFNNNVSTTLYVDGVAKRSATLRDGKVTYSSLSINVKDGVDAQVEIKADFAEATAITGGESISFYLKTGDVTATDSQGLTVTPASQIDGATVTVQGAGELTIKNSSSTPAATLLGGGLTDVEVARFGLKATNDDIKLTDIYLHNSGSLEVSDRLHTFTLFDADDLETALATATTTTTKGIAFESLDGSNIIIPAGLTKTLVLKVSVNNVQNIADLSGKNLLKLSVNSVDFTPTVGTTNGIRAISQGNGSLVTTVTPATSDYISNEHKVVRGFPMFAKLDFTSSFAESTNNIMRVSVTAVGNEVTLTGLDFVTSNVNGGNFEIYKGANGSTTYVSSDLVATGATAASINVDFGSNELNIAEGSTIILYIVGDINVQNVYNGGGTKLERNVKIDAVGYSDIFSDGDMLVTDAAAYIGTSLPLNETY